MKRIPVLLLLTVLFMSPVIAGGIVTNTNHSAKFTRMQCRDATLGIDAVYYNPAGLTKLGNGFHFSINNQTIGQGRKISSDYTYLIPSPKDFEASVSAPLFPGVYAAFRLGKFAISAGFNPIGGGGSANYEEGIPSLEYGVSDLVPMLTAQGQNVTDYDLNALFEGSSVFYGYQANLSYKINDMISVAVGGRYVTAKETYNGHLKDVRILLGGTWIPATTFFEGAAADYTTYATQFSGAATNLQNAISGGLIGANDPLADPVAIGTLTALGLYTAGMTNTQAVAAFTGAAASATAGAQQATAAATALADQEVDAEKTASGITPIVSLNVSPIEMLNIALKYEFKTKLEFTTSAVTGKEGLLGFDPVTGNPKYMFTDGEKTNLDIPAMLSAGVLLNPISPLLISGGFHYYFDQNANWDGREEKLDRGLYEIALGAEYGLGEKVSLSGGWLMTSTGVTEEYQTDQSYSLNTNTFGGGLGFKITDMIELNLAGSYTMYQEGEKNFQRELGGEGQSGTYIPLTETYNKNTWVVAVGLDISIAR
jgi:long-chain fatty acid transport protein